MPSQKLRPVQKSAPGLLGAQNNRLIETVLSSTHILNKQYLFKTVSISIIMLQFALHLQPNFKISSFGVSLR